MGEGAYERSQGLSLLPQVLVGLLLTQGILESTRVIGVDLK